MIKEFYSSLREFKIYIKSYVTFNIIVLVFSSILFIPFFSYLINRLFLSRDAGVILNADIFKVVLSYKGILTFAGLSLLGVLVLFIILGTQLIYSEMIIKNKDVTMVESLLTTLKALPKLIRFELIYFAMLTFLMIPLIEYETNPFLRYFMETPPRLLDSLEFIPFGKIAYLVALTIIFYLFLRTIFLFHGVLLERKSIKASLKLSLSLTKGKSLLIFMKLLILNTILIGVLFGLYYVLSQIPGVLNIPVNYVVRQYVITMAGVGLILYLMMIIPINLLFLTRRYHNLMADLGIMNNPDIHLIQWKRISKLERNLVEKTFTKKTTFGLFLILSVLVAFAVGFRINQSFLYKGRNILIAAHRGDERAAPENTMAAIDSAVRNGADLIEIDLQMTKDGVIVLHHDSSLIRTAGISESVSNLTYDEMRNLDVGSHFHDNFRSERIPSLEEVFLMAEKDEKYLLDVKTNGDEDELVREILNLVTAYEMEEKVLIQSLNYTFLKKMREKNDSMKLGQIMYAAFGKLKDLDVDFYTVKKDMLTKQLISRARKAEKGIFVWVIDKEDELKNIMTFDIDGVITSNLEMTYQLLRSEVDTTEDDEPKDSDYSFLFE